MNIQIISFVVSAMLGSGIFLLPILMKGLNFNTIIGFTAVSVISSIIGYFFTTIDKSISELLEEKLGKKAAFLGTWSYWLISWVSTAIVINEISIYAKASFPEIGQYLSLIQGGIVLLFIFINLFGIKSSSYLELILTGIKILVLVFFPLYAIIFGKISIEQSFSINFFQSLSATKIALWSFVGLECGVIIGKNIQSDKKSLKKSVIFGFILTALIYLLNIFAIFKTVGFNFFSNPYIDLSVILFGKIGEKIFSIIVILVCLGTLNSWIASSALIGLEASEAKLFPKIFKKTNKFDSPYFSLLISSLPLVIFCFVQNINFIANGVRKFVEMAGETFFFYYALVLIALFLKRKNILLIPIILLLLFIVFSSGIINILVVLGIFISGIPFYYLFYNKNSNKIE